MLWLTVARIVVFVICASSFSIMLIGFARHHERWNQKTRDYWYGRVMWSVSGMSLTLEGLLRHTSFRYSLVIVGAAALATLKANLQRGRWGNEDD